MKIRLIFSTVGQPRGRAEIERFFESLAQVFLSRLPGYARSPADRNAVLTLLQLGQELERYLIGEYLVTPHRTTGHGKLKGRITRATGFTGPVTITLIGLPAGLKAPTVTVPEDRSSLELPLALSYDTKLEALLNLKAVATSQVGPQRVLKKSEIPVSIQIVQGDVPDS